MKRLAILGASGHGKVIADTALVIGWDEIVFFDDAWPEKHENGRWPILGGTQQLVEQLSTFQGVVVGIGDCAIRWDKYQLLKQASASLVNIIHPSASVSQFAEIGNGSVLFVGSVVNVDVVLGEASILNTGATVDHDCVIGDAVHIAPGASISGDVTISAQSWVGVGASIRQGIRVGKGVLIGAGAVVVNDVVDDTVVAGNPARVLKSR